MLDDTFQPDSFARRLRRTGLESHVDNVDMEMIIGGLVVHIQLELVALNFRIHLFRGLDKLGLHVLEPGDVLHLEVSQAPDVPALHKTQEVKGLDGLFVPVQIRCQKETFVTSLAKRCPVDHILNFFSPLNDIEHPIQPALVALGLHVRPDFVAIYFWCFGDETNALFAVFFDVLLCAWVDKINFQIGELMLIGSVFDCAATGHVPVVNVIGAQILECPQAARYGAKVVVGGRKGCSLEYQQRGLLVNGTA